MKTVTELRNALHAAGIKFIDESADGCLNGGTIYAEGANGVKMTFWYYEGGVSSSAAKTAANGRPSDVTLRKALSHLK